MFMEMAKQHTPECLFPKTGGDFKEWKAKTKPRVLETLGRWPDMVDLNPEFVGEWIDRGVLKRRYLIDVAPGISASLQVNLPEGKTKEKLPAIQCWHGHGLYGKDAVMGNQINAEVEAHIRGYNYDYGLQLAQAGFATYAIDWMGCGERNDAAKPNFFNHLGERDWCNIYYLHATMFGMTSLSINLAHGKRATDFICTLPEIDASRLGVMGLSGGGTMAVWTPLVDDRFKAVEVICYSDVWAKFGIRDLNYCGMQVAPGLYQLIDVPDLQGLIAPTPLLVDVGANDSCFQLDNSMECFHRVEKIYEAAGVRENLELNLFAGGHAWNDAKSATFFKKHLPK